MSRIYTVGSLFSGIGGIELGLESCGRYETRWFAEADPFCREVIGKNWKGKKIYEDVKDVKIEDAVERVDIVCGGFPCQDLSVARENSGKGRGKGLDGSKSGLYREFIRIIGEFRPMGFIIENVPTLVNRGLYRILHEVAEIGYNAEWHIVSARSVGAPHLRKRLFIMGHSNSSHTQGGGLPCGIQEEIANTYSSSDRGSTEAWPTEPDLPRVAHGVPDWSHRVKSLGNAVVPAAAGVIGKRLLEILDNGEGNE